MICNSTPLISLSKIGELELLKKLFGKIIIPNAVKKEVLIEGKAGYFEITQALNENWIRVIDPKHIVEFGLEKGEEAAIALAREKRDKLIMDDDIAFKMAKALGIDLFRTTNVITMAVKKNILSKKEGVVLLNKLIEKGYYLSPRHYVALLEKLKE